MTHRTRPIRLSNITTKQTDHPVTDLEGVLR